METKHEAYRVGDYYLSQNRQGYWCRTWYDHKAQQRKASSLRTKCLETAKRTLDQWFIDNTTPVLDCDLELSRCLLEYYKQHAKHLARSEAERHNLSIWVEHFPGMMVKEVRAPQQREFIGHLVSKGYAKSTVESIFKSGAAAINFAWKNDMLLNQLPLISATKELKKHAFNGGERWRALTVDEVVALFESANTSRLMRYIMVLIATGSRPGAALELHGSQIDLDAGTINLLPDGREQNNKYRPIVKLPSFIRAIHHDDNICSQDEITLNRKRPMDSIKSSWLTARRRAELDELVNPYSIRHTMAKWLRSCGVQPWHTSSQLGHRRQGSEITEVYASFDPEYLADALEAIEGFFAIIYERSPKLRSADWLSNYTPRCDLVAKFERCAR